MVAHTKNKKNFLTISCQIIDFFVKKAHHEHAIPKSHKYKNKNELTRLHCFSEL